MGKKVSIGTDNLAIYWSLHDVLIFSFYILLKTSSETEHEFTAVFSNSLHSGHILCAGTICRTDTSSEPSLRQGEVFEHTPASAAGSPHQIQPTCEDSLSSRGSVANTRADVPTSHTTYQVNGQHGYARSMFITCHLSFHPQYFQTRKCIPKDPRFSLGHELKTSLMPNIYIQGKNKRKMKIYSNSKQHNPL